MGWGSKYHFCFYCCFRRFFNNWRIRFSNARKEKTGCLCMRQLWDKPL